MAHNAPEGRTAAEKRGHELFDLDVSYIGWFSVGLIILLIVTAGTAFYMLGGFRVSDAVLAKQSTEGSLTGPFATLQETPQDDLRSYRRSKAAGLEGYHWVDRSAGVVQIPIERAMELIAAGSAAPPAANSMAPMDQSTSPPPPQQPRGHKP
jgi:hypothetical protein